MSAGSASRPARYLAGPDRHCPGTYAGARGLALVRETGRGGKHARCIGNAACIGGPSGGTATRRGTTAAARRERQRGCLQPYNEGLSHGSIILQTRPSGQELQWELTDTVKWPSIRRCDAHSTIGYPGPLAHAQPACAYALPFGRRGGWSAWSCRSAGTARCRRKNCATSRHCWTRRHCSQPRICSCSNGAADYYHHPIGEVVATALPRLLRTVRKRRAKAAAAASAVDGTVPLVLARGAPQPERCASCRRAHTARSGQPRAAATSCSMA